MHRLSLASATATISHLFATTRMRASPTATITMRRNAIILHDSTDMGVPCGSSAAVVSGSQAAVENNSTSFLSPPATLAASLEHLECSMHSSSCTAHPLVAASSLLSRTSSTGRVAGYMQRALMLRTTPARRMSTVAASGAASTSVWKPSVVYAKVGTNGKYANLAIEWKHLAKLRTGGLLTALIKDDLFGPDLKDVKLIDCTVSIRKGTLVDVKAAAALPGGTSAELKIGETVGSKAKGSGMGGNLLLIDVHLPPALSAKMAINAAVLLEATTADQLYALLPVRVQADVDSARAYRSKLAGVRALMGMTSHMSSAEAADLGIEVLHETATGTMTTGIFDIPPLDIPCSMVPKSESCCCA